MSDLKCLDKDKEIESLRIQLVCAREEFEKMRKECEIAKDQLHEVTKKVKFLEGQIEAYQYCMNCRR